MVATSLQIPTAIEAGCPHELCDESVFQDTIHRIAAFACRFSEPRRSSRMSLASGGGPIDAE
jgi:hypothetical protein